MTASIPGGRTRVPGRTGALLLALAILVGLGWRLTAVPRGVASAQRALEASDLATAEQRWRDVLALEPGRPDALYGLGWTLHLAGKPELAREAFQQCVDANPADHLGYKGLGSVAMSEGNTSLARRRFEESLARAPEDAAVRHSLALLDLGQGKAADAIPAFESLIEEEPERSVFRQGLAEALLAAGRPDEALAAASDAARLAEDDRGRALAGLTRARSILATLSGRVDPQDCEHTAPPVYAWLEEADRALDEVESAGVPIPEVLGTRRSVRQRRGWVDDTCPGVRAGVGRSFPGG